MEVIVGESSIAEPTAYYPCWVVGSVSLHYMSAEMIEWTWLLTN